MIDCPVIDNGHERNLLGRPLFVYNLCVCVYIYIFAYTYKCMSIATTIICFFEIFYSGKVMGYDFSRLISNHNIYAIIIPLRGIYIHTHI